MWSTLTINHKTDLIICRFHHHSFLAMNDLMHMITCYETFFHSINFSLYNSESNRFIEIYVLIAPKCTWTHCILSFVTLFFAHLILDAVFFHITIFCVFWFVFLVHFWSNALSRCAKYKKWTKCISKSIKRHRKKNENKKIHTNEQKALKKMQRMEQNNVQNKTIKFHSYSALRHYCIGGLIYRTRTKRYFIHTTTNELWIIYVWYKCVDWIRFSLFSLFTIFSVRFTIWTRMYQYKIVFANITD